MRGPPPDYYYYFILFIYFLASAVKTRRFKAKVKTKKARELTPQLLAACCCCCYSNVGLQYLLEQRNNITFRGGVVISLHKLIVYNVKQYIMSGCHSTVQASCVVLDKQTAHAHLPSLLLLLAVPPGATKV